MSRYHIVTTWRLRASLEEVGAVLAEPERLPEWWPSVYLDAREVAPGDASGVGKAVELWTKGWLPYTLRWRFRVTEVDTAGRVVLEPEGDFTGRGVWTVWQEGPVAVVRYDWAVEAQKPLLRALGPVLRPAFVANHLWAMRRGEESLALEIARRRAGTAEERERVPPPPGRSWLSFGAARGGRPAARVRGPASP